MLIAIVTYDTEENGRSELTRQCLDSIYDTVNWSKHRLVVSDNGSCERTKGMLTELACHTLWNEGNIGTARAINRAWKLAGPAEVVCKVDNDVKFLDPGWADVMEHVARQQGVGIVGLKRKDLRESPSAASLLYKTRLELWRDAQGFWLPVEIAQSIMGTVTAFSVALRARIGGLYQMGGLYGYDDALASIRCNIAGLANLFIPHLRIEHLDPGAGEYQKWKESYSGERMKEYEAAKSQFKSGRLPLYQMPL